MRSLSLFLVAGLQLCCSAKHHPFSIYEDMLAHPQFEVVFSESYISEAEAQALLDNVAKQASSSSPTRSADPSTATDPPIAETTTPKDDGSNDESKGSSSSSPPGTGSIYDDDESDDFPVISETYELINVPPSRYLCSLPVIAPPAAPNQTATELAKAEEAREMSRAAAKGWELMSGLEGTCMYYVSGWWSYSFCYNSEIVQFHALQPSVKGGPPIKDPKSQDYVLGRAPRLTDHPATRAGSGREQQAVMKQDGAESTSHTPPNTDLVVKGDQRYLVQRLDGGTICDLTGRPRTIDIQYHCAPGASIDRVAWIKEVTTCTYLMMVQTPRLCADAAFLPPKPTRAHPISCRLVVGTDEEAKRWHEQKTAEARLAMGGGVGQRGERDRNPSRAGPNDYTGLKIGGIVIGGKKLLRTNQEQDAEEAAAPVVKLEPPAPVRRIGSLRFAGGGADGDAFVEVLAIAKSKAKGGEVIVLDDEELERLDIDPATVEALRKEVQAMAGEKGWKLEMVEEPGEIAEIRGIVSEGDDDDFGVGEEGVQGQKNEQPTRGAAAGGAAAGAGEGDRRAVGNDRDRGTNAAAAGRKAQKTGGKKGGDAANKAGEEEEATAGSQEKFFKDEL